MAAKIVTVNLRITGLCGLVKNPGNTRMRIVLLNARDQLMGGHHDEPHHAVLLVDELNNPVCASLDQDDRFIFVKERSIIGGKKVDQLVSAYLLDSVDLSVSHPAVSPFTFEPRTEPHCPDTDFTGFDWVAKMSVVNAGTIKDSVLTSDNPAGVLARFALDGGRLSTSHFRQVPVPGGGTNTVKWQFEDDLGTVIGDQRALSEEILLTSVHNVPVGDDFSIRLRFFNDDTDEIFITPDPNGEVRLWLQNMPLANILGIVHGNAEDPDTHFVHFYDLAEPAAPGPFTFYYPHAVLPRCARGFAGLTGPKCPVALFNDSNNA